jgi:hypothetical protein
MDTYQGSLHHSSILAQSQVLEGDEINQADSWVMLRHDGEIEPLPKEQILLVTPPRVSLELSVPKSLRNESNASFSVKNDDGTAYVTNQRVSQMTTHQPVVRRADSGSIGHLPSRTTE